MSALLSFYTYIIINIIQHLVTTEEVLFSKSKTIVENAQSAPENGWKAFESNKNRYWIAEELLDAKYIFHSLYKYHRNGLDIMYEDNDKEEYMLLKALQI